MRMRRWLKGAVALLVGLVVFGTGMPAFAQIHEPDVSFSINQIEVYRDAIEEDAQLYIITYECEYNTSPSVGIDEAFLFRLMNGTTELATVTAHPHFDSGYDLGIASGWFDAASAPAWNGAYTVEFRGNPMLQWLDTAAATAMAGAVADDGGTQTDETTESNSAAANDMTLMPVAPVVDDAYYFGANGLFDILTVNIGTVGNWTGTYIWEYWNGAEWVAVSGLTDGTTGFTAGTDTYDVTYTCPIDWQQSTVSGSLAYWLRFRVVTISAIVAQPLGTQSWTNAMDDPPSTSTDSFSLWYDGGGVGATESRLATRILALAHILENDWGGTTDLVEDVGGENKLTTDGEEYFTNAIPGLRQICPDIFAEVIDTVELEGELVFGDFNTGGDDVDEDVFGTNWYAQTFTASADYTINGVQIRALTIGAPVDVIISIRATAAGLLPTGADLVTGTMNADLTTNVIGAWYSWTFTQDLTVTQGTTYAIVVRAPGGNATNYLGWRANSGTYSYIGAGGASGNYYYVGSTLAAGGVFYIGSSVFAGGSFYVGSGVLTGSYYGGGQAFVSADGGATWSAIAGGAYDFMFLTAAREDFYVSYRNRLANRLVGTRFDMTNLGTNLGMSRMWTSALVWFLFCTLLPTIFVCRWARSFKPATLTIMLLLPIGALAGFIYLEVAVLAAFLSGAAATYIFLFRGASA